MYLECVREAIAHKDARLPLHRDRHWSQSNVEKVFGSADRGKLYFYSREKIAKLLVVRRDAGELRELVCQAMLPLQVVAAARRHLFVAFEACLQLMMARGLDLPGQEARRPW